MGVRPVNNDCQPNVVGNVHDFGLEVNFNLRCGDQSLYYEAILSPLPTLTIRGNTNTDNTECQAVLVIEQGDGTLIELDLPSVQDVNNAILLTVPDVRKVFVRCEGVGGPASRCRGNLIFSVQYCDCTGICCTCQSGKPVQIGEQIDLSVGFDVSCGAETGPLYMSLLKCAPTVTILPTVNQSEQGLLVCESILVIELEDGTTIEREITPLFDQEPPVPSSSPIFTIAHVREVRLRCAIGPGTGDC